MDRDIFLSRVGQAAMDTVLPDPPSVAPELPFLEPDDLVALFRERAQIVDTVVHGPISSHGVPRAIVGIANGHGARKFIAWDELPAPGVATALTSAGIERVDAVVDDHDRKSHQLSYQDVDLGITGALAGLADSGSLVLSHGKGRPRMASLVPEVHVALLDISTLNRTLAHWAHDYPDHVRDTSNLVMVTGPSRTGDIEQALNLGVHGPRHVHVVLVK